MKTLFIALFILVLFISLIAWSCCAIAGKTDRITMHISAHNVDYCDTVKNPSSDECQSLYNPVSVGIQFLDVNSPEEGGEATLEEIIEVLRIQWSKLLPDSTFYPIVINDMGINAEGKWEKIKN